MRNNAGLHARSPRSGRSSSFFPSSLRAISSYLRNVSVNASSIASTVRSAGASVASTVSLPEDERQREQVQWAGFDRLELSPTESRHVLLLTYLNGFQVWDVEDADDVRELVSKRDGPVGFLRLQPRPCLPEPSDGCLKASWPLMSVVTGDANCGHSEAPGACTGGSSGVVGNPLTVGGNHFVPTVVNFYSLVTHTYVNTLRFRTAICSIRWSPRILVVALATQIYCFDAATLQNTLSVLTYPSPQAGLSGSNIGYGAMAVGPRWLAYAANQPLVSNTGRVSPQHLTPSPGVSPSSSPGNGSLVAHYAKESSKHIAAGIVTLGDMGYKTVSKYCSELLPDASGSPVSGSPSRKTRSNGYSHDPEHAGTVIVRDFVSKTVISQFRAHTSPLSALCFDPSGTLLVTASIHGHNLNIFRLTTLSNGAGMNSAGFDASTSHVHLYKLCRGITNAVIQDVAFSDDSRWIAISSSRGTSHLFAISPFGGIVGTHTHGMVPVDGTPGTVLPMPALPWWSSSGLVKSSQQAVMPPPSPITLSVVSRIKNGNGGWRGTVSGAAAAATGRMNFSSGPVAVVFHDGGKRSFESEVGYSSLKDTVWVLSPSGHLMRYALRPSAGTDGFNCNNGSAGVRVSGHCSPSQAQDFRVFVEPLQKWDVCRRSNWMEREEKLDTLIRQDAVQDEASATGVSSCEKGGSIAVTLGSGRLRKERMSAEDMHCWYFSNAEVQMHQARPPLWAKSEIAFHVLTGTATNHGNGELGGETEIENFPTRVVEVRRKDLVPVFERLQIFKGVQGVRDLSVESSPILAGFPMPVLKDDFLHEDFIGPNLGCVEIQRSSSGSSCGSETGSFSSPNMGLNGFHHAFKDSQEAHTQGVPSYSEATASFIHQTQPSPKIPGKSFLQFGQMPNSDISKPKFASYASAPVVIGSPPMDIPQQGGRDVYDTAQGYTKGVTEVNPASLGDLRNLVTLPSNAKHEACSIQDENRSDIMFACGVLEDGSVPCGSFVDGGVLDHGVASNAPTLDRWEKSVAEGKTMPPLQLRYHDNINQGSRGEPVDMYNRDRDHPQECDAAAEDVESTDANSKSEDFEGEQGEDVWEGAMFPFVEDG